MSRELGAIGARLRAIRENERMSLREASAAAGISASFLGGLERGETEIAVTRLMRLADVYGVSVADLLVELPASIDRLHVPADSFSRTSADAGRVEILYPPAPPGFVQPFRLLLHPGASEVGFVHTAEEFHHCVRGRAAVTLGDETVDMRPGDTVYIPARTVHGWANPHRGLAIMVGAVRRDGS